MVAKLKDVKVILTLLLIISWIGAGVTCFIIYNTKDKQLEKTKTELAQLQSTMSSMGDLVTAYTLNDDVEIGEKIESDDYTAIQVPSTMANGLIQDESQLDGKYYRMDLSTGNAISSDDVYDEKISDDLRLLDVVLNTVPVGLKVGSYVDVRITMPDGQDYIAISHKQVKDINSGVLKLAVNEHDIHAYNSMLIDSLMYAGTTMYAVEYVEGGLQKASDTYYPMSKKVLAIANKDPNLLTAIKSDILKKRGLLEANLTSVADGENVSQSEIDSILESGRDKYQSAYSDAENEYQTKAEQEAEKAAEEAQAGNE